MDCAVAFPQYIPPHQLVLKLCVHSTRQDYTQTLSRYYICRFKEAAVRLFTRTPNVQISAVCALLHSFRSEPASWSFYLFALPATSSNFSSEVKRPWLVLSQHWQSFCAWLRLWGCGSCWSCGFFLIASQLHSSADIYRHLHDTLNGIHCNVKEHT